MKHAPIMLTFLLLLSTCVFAGGCQRNSETPLPYGELPDVTFVNDLPAWKGIVPGKTTRKEVLEILGTPETTWSFNELEVIRYLPNGYKRAVGDLSQYYRLVLSQDIVQVIDIEVRGYRYGDLLADWGSPDRFIEYAEQDDIALFPTRGIAVAVNSWTPASIDAARVTRLRCFVPASVTNYLAEWVEFHPQYLPWQRSIPDRIYELDISPGVTTEKDIKDLFGTPDFEWKNGRFKETAYHFSNMPPYVIDRFRFSRGVLIWMNAVLQQENETIGKAVEHMGLPEAVICHQRSHLLSPLQQYIWPDRGIVLVSQVSEEQSNEIMVSSIGDCAKPSSNDIVRGYVRTEPLPLEKFLDRKLDIQIMEEASYLGYYCPLH